ncbi:hypothetical protein BRN14_04710, partial [Xanthomonas oryzae pv. oryzae]
MEHRTHAGQIAGVIATGVELAEQHVAPPVPAEIRHVGQVQVERRNGRRIGQAADHHWRYRRMLLQARACQL